MTEDEILDDVGRLVATLLDRPDIAITMTSQTASIEGWDSMKQVMFIMALEEKFAIRLTNPEIAQMRRIGDAVRIIGAKLSVP